MQNILAVMGKICHLIIGLVTAITLIACSTKMSTKELANKVKMEMTETLANDGTFDFLNGIIEEIAPSKSLHTRIIDVQLVHEEGNKYVGFLTAEIQLGDFYAEYKYPLHVVYDGTDILWEVDSDNASIEHFNFNNYGTN